LAYFSATEQAVVNARQPLALPASGRVQAGGFSGAQLNKHEELAFRGPRPLETYPINNDLNPQVIRKQSAPVRYTQQVAVRRLNPPTPPPHGDLIVKEFQRQIPAGPPVVLRQEGRRAATPPPQVFREAPPAPPPRIPTQVVNVEGTPVPPPARKVVYEKLADQPAKPQNILIEKWLPYKPRTRRVVFQRSCVPPPPNPRNLVIEWEQPCVQVDQQCIDLGVVDADPQEYVCRYGPELKRPEEIPPLRQSGGCQSGLQRSATWGASETLRLEGDVEALRRVDLVAEGLGEYARFL
jgi:hypothetical protein